VTLTHKIEKSKFFRPVKMQVSSHVVCFLGYFTDQSAVESLIANGSLPSGNVPGPGIARQEGFHLNNFSFAGPVVMGVGGKANHLK